ncbi:Trigger factor [Galdieria sulphuraria]|nr:Trigger factor [Galdieria sulphuraria]
MWSFQSSPVLHVIRFPCRVCNKTTNHPQQFFCSQYTSFCPRKVLRLKLERGHSVRCVTRTFTCNVKTESVPDLEEQSYEIVEEKRLPGSKLCIHVRVSGFRTKQCFESQLSEYSKTAIVPGFRKGKVPRPVLINQVGSTVASKACRELIQETVRQVLTKESYTPLSKATLSDNEEEIVNTFEPGRPFSFQFVFETYPLVNFKDDYKGLHLKSYKRETPTG